MKTYSEGEIEKIKAQAIIDFIQFVKNNLCMKELNTDGRLFLDKQIYEKTKIVNNDN